MVIGLTFGFLLLFKRGSNRKSNRYLAALMFIIALWNGTLLTLDLGIYRYAIGIIWVPFSFTLALGPCFYFYVKSITNVNFLPDSKVWIHFIPVVVEVGLFFTQVFIGIPKAKGYFQTDLYLLTQPIIDVLAIVSFLIYSYYARQKILAYHGWVKDNFSDDHRYNLNWLFRLSSIFLMFLAIWLFYFCFDYFFFDYQLSFYDYYPFHLILAVIAIWLSAESFLQSSIVFPEKTIHQKEESKEPVELNEDHQEKANWLKQQIEENKLYLDADLSLSSLAETIELHPNLVSKLINDGLGKTFSDCINEYRVQAVIKQLENPELQNANFLAIAFDCGFNSKATFNRVFKKVVGKTPAQYRNEVL